MKLKWAELTDLKDDVEVDAGDGDDGDGGRKINELCFKNDLECVFAFKELFFCVNK